jgi:hypothetical protein
MLEHLETRLTPTTWTVGAGDVAGLIADINAANQAGGSNTINLSPGVYDLTNVDNFWYGPNGLPPIFNNLTIHGNGATIQRDSSATPFRLFYVSGGLELPAGSLTMDNVTLEGGLAQGGDGSGGGMGAGGAIFNQGMLNLTSVTLTNNEALGGSGGQGLFSGNGGGMGPGSGFGGSLAGGPFGGAGGAGSLVFGGGGGGFVTGADGAPAGNGGLGGFGTGGDGGVGGAITSSIPFVGGNGGSFGVGGGGNGGGGGVGGGGGANVFGNGGGGGFGGGGGDGSAINTNEAFGGSGGFGGGGGSSRGFGSFGGGGGGGFGGGNGGLLASGNRNYDGGGGGGFGGAIFNMGADSADAGSGQAILVNCTFTNNTAQGGNGGSGSPPDRNGDGGSGYGGAVFNLDGQVTLTNDTLDANNVVGGSGGSGGLIGFGGLSGNPGDSDGGAVYNLAFGNDIRTGNPVTATLILNNSILADSNGSSNDLVANVVNGKGSNAATVSGSTNLVMSNLIKGGSTIDPSVITVTTDPNLGPLKDNGGLTFTMLPGPKSPALGAGNPNLAPSTDQRGLPRPPGGPTDLGSVQVSEVGPGATAIATSNVTTTFLQFNQAVTLIADVTSDAGPVNEGTVKFTILQGGSTIIGVPQTSATVSNGVASVSYALPAGTVVGSYHIIAEFFPALGSEFTYSLDNSHVLTINPASTTTTVSNATAVFSASDQNVTLTANVISDAGPVFEGTVTFTISQNGTIIGTATTSNGVRNGVASVSYVLPGGTPPGTYIIDATYNPGPDFKASHGQGSLVVSSSSSSVGGTSSVGGSPSVVGSSSVVGSPSVVGSSSVGTGATSAGILGLALEEIELALDTVLVRVLDALHLPDASLHATIDQLHTSITNDPLFATFGKQLAVLLDDLVMQNVLSAS